MTRLLLLLTLLPSAVMAQEHHERHHAYYQGWVLAGTGHSQSENRPLTLRVQRKGGRS
jgi:hypothetical protein